MKHFPSSALLRPSALSLGNFIRRPLGTLLILLSGCANALGGGASANTTPEAELPLAIRIDQLLAEPPFNGVQWGILIIDGENGRTIYERNPATRLIPASNMKIPVTAAALDLLGPDFRWETSFFSGSPVSEGTVTGPLGLVGTGDPTLGAPFFSSSTEALGALADSLFAAGVRRVTGPLVVDVSRWDSTTVPESWMVGNLSPAFGSTGGAFVVGRGEVSITVIGGATPGAPAAMDWSPRGDFDFVRSEVTTAAPGDSAAVRTAFLPESRRWHLTGTVRPGEVRTIILAARDPVRLAADALGRTLRERGIALEGGVEIDWGVQGNDSTTGGDAIAGREPGPGIPNSGLPTPGDPGPTIPPLAPVHRIAGLTSPPLVEVVHTLLDTSQNWMTEQLVRTLGAERGEGGRWSEGFQVIENYLVADIGVDSLDLHMEDGSGLSAYNLLTPRAIIRLLAHARMQPWADEYRNALPTPGRSGGTLTGRLAGLEGQVHAKTGTIMNVNSLSGYLRSDGEREVIFSILSNGSNLPASQVRERMDALVRELAEGR